MHQAVDDSVSQRSSWRLTTRILLVGALLAVVSACSGEDFTIVDGSVDGSQDGALEAGDGGLDDGAVQDGATDAAAEDAGTMDGGAEDCPLPWLLYVQRGEDHGAVHRLSVRADGVDACPVWMGGGTLDGLSAYALPVAPNRVAVAGPEGVQMLDTTTDEVLWTQPGEDLRGERVELYRLPGDTFAAAYTSNGNSSWFEAIIEYTLDGEVRGNLTPHSENIRSLTHFRGEDGPLLVLDERSRILKIDAGLVVETIHPSFGGRSVRMVTDPVRVVAHGSGVVEIREGEEPELLVSQCGWLVNVVPDPTRPQGYFYACSDGNFHTATRILRYDAETGATEIVARSLNVRAIDTFQGL